MDHILKQLRAQLDAAETALVEKELRSTAGLPWAVFGHGGPGRHELHGDGAQGAVHMYNGVPLTAVHDNTVAVAFINSMAGASSQS